MRASISLRSTELPQSTAAQSRTHAGLYEAEIRRPCRLKSAWDASEQAAGLIRRPLNHKEAWKEHGYPMSATYASLVSVAGELRLPVTHKECKLSRQRQVVVRFGDEHLWSAPTQLMWKKGGDRGKQPHCFHRWCGKNIASKPVPTDGRELCSTVAGLWPTLTCPDETTFGARGSEHDYLPAEAGSETGVAVALATRGLRIEDCFVAENVARRTPCFSAGSGREVFLTTGVSEQGGPQECRSKFGAPKMPRLREREYGRDRGATTGRRVMQSSQVSSAKS